MLVELWHHWLLLRPLLVLLLGSPLIILGLLFRGREPQGSQRSADARASAIGNVRPGAERDASRRGESASARRGRQPEQQPVVCLE